MREHKGETSRGFDFAGLVFMALFLCGLNLALADGNAAWNTDGWTSQFILSCFGLSILGFLAFITIELSVRHPLINLSLFRTRNFSLAVLVLFLFGFGMFGATFLMPIYMQRALGYTPFQAGMISLPMGLLTALASPISGAVGDRIGAKIPLVLGLVFMALSFHLNSFLALETETSRIMVPLCIRGFSMGFVLTPLSTIAISQIPQGNLAQASALTNVARQIGGSVGVAVFGSLLTSRTKVHLAGLGLGLDPSSAAFRDALGKLSAFAMRVSGGTSSLSARRGQSLLFARIGRAAFVESVCDVFSVAALILAVAVLPIFLMGKLPRKGDLKGRPANERP